MKHTPGPWTSIENMDTGNTTTIFATNFSSKLHIAEVTGSLQTFNAALIAAAPDMLAALEWALQNAEWSNDTATGTDLIRAAITKARGQE